MLEAGQAVCAHTHFTHPNPDADTIERVARPHRWAGLGVALPGASGGGACVRREAGARAAPVRIRQRQRSQSALVNALSAHGLARQKVCLADPGLLSFPKALAYLGMKQAGGYLVRLFLLLRLYVR